jgi:hypothetical protein
MADDNQLPQPSGGRPPSNPDWQAILDKLRALGNRVYFHLDLDVNGWMIAGAFVILVILLKI